MATTDSISVLIVDDQRLMRDGLRTLLELEADLAVVGEAQDGEAALAAYGELAPDVVLMDIRMPLMDGVEATKRICERWPEARILILTTFDQDAYVFEGLRAGALGYLLKDVSGQELASAVRAVAAGSALIGPSVARKVLGTLSRGVAGAAGDEAGQPGLTEPLSEREREILVLVAQGLSNPQIGAELHLAEGTIKNYVSSILQKTGTHDRTEAAVRARTLGLI